MDIISTSNNSYPRDRLVHVEELPEADLDQLARLCINKNLLSESELRFELQAGSSVCINFWDQTKNFCYKMQNARSFRSAGSATPTQRGLFQHEIDGSADVVRRGADISGEFTGFSAPDPFRIVVTGEHPGVDFERDGSALAGREVYLFKPLSSFTGRGCDESLSPI